MPIKKTPDGRIVEEKTKAVGFGGGDKTRIVGGGRRSDRTVLSSENPTGRDALDDKTRLVGQEPRGKAGQTHSKTRGQGVANLGATVTVGGPSARSSGRVAKGTDESPKTQLVRAESGDDVQITPATDDPVVGWLVVQDGPGKGHSVPLGIGMNSVGRGTSARTTLSFGDHTLSSDKHFLISFDPRSARFAIHRGDSANLTYLNAEPVYGTEPLSNFDIIEAGQSKLCFVAFCGEQFNWDA